MAELQLGLGATEVPSSVNQVRFGIPGALGSNKGNYEDFGLTSMKRERELADEKSKLDNALNSGLAGSLGSIPMDELVDIQKGGENAQRMVEVIADMRAMGMSSEDDQKIRMLLGDMRDKANNTEVLMKVAAPIAENLKVNRVLSGIRSGPEWDEFSKNLSDEKTSITQKLADIGKREAAGQLSVGDKRMANQLRSRLDAMKWAETEWMINQVSTAPNMDLGVKEKTVKMLASVLKEARGGKEKRESTMTATALFNDWAKNNKDAMNVMGSMTRLSEQIPEMETKVRAMKPTKVMKPSEYDKYNEHDQVVAVKDQSGRDWNSVLATKGEGSKLRADIMMFANKYLKDMSGAAVTASEGLRFFQALGMPEVASTLASASEEEKAKFDALTLVQKALDKAGKFNVRFFPEAALQSLKNLYVMQYKALEKNSQRILQSETAPEDLMEHIETSLRVYDPGDMAEVEVPGFAYGERVGAGEAYDTEAYEGFAGFTQASLDNITDYAARKVGDWKGDEDITYFLYKGLSKAEGNHRATVANLVAEHETLGTAEGKKRIGDLVIADPLFAKAYATELGFADNAKFMQSVMSANGVPYRGQQTASPPQIAQWISMNQGPLKGKLREIADEWGLFTDRDNFRDTWGKLTPAQQARFKKFGLLPDEKYNKGVVYLPDGSKLTEAELEARQEKYLKELEN